MAAPVAEFDEDWQDFNEFKAASDETLDRLNCNQAELEPKPGPEEDLWAELQSSVCGETRSFVSVEELVQNFHQRLGVCFTDHSSSTEKISEPVEPITEENLLQQDEIWNALTENYGNVMPVDWKTSYTRSLHLPSLNLHQQQLESVNLDLSDDEELREQMDLHSIIVSCVNEEPLFTAEQVISEIEEMMMQESPVEDNEDSPSDLSTLSQELHTLPHSTSTSSFEERLRAMSVAELEARLDEVEKKIRTFSEELIDQLALRDELDFEKEVKNSFISLLIDIQNRQKEAIKKRRKSRNTTAGTLRGEHAPGTYLTTVIPYEKRSGAPSVEDLQILTKILHAMREDSDKVPSLLTEYILKVLCPT
ncbi:fasciculation and elongation protein zeta-2 isoform X2 [Trichomycterus rosablanca]|uniref:fasciculation and elongation protein zeta-2 isoform X2 n=1 Tax=Trichomycterus rosablanca TaxID=2290929 RepID=UPI002F360B55